MRGDARIRKTIPCPRSAPSLVRGKRTLKEHFSVGSQDRMEAWGPQEQPSSTGRGFREVSLEGVSTLCSAGIGQGKGGVGMPPQAINPRILTVLAAQQADLSRKQDLESH